MIRDRLRDLAGAALKAVAPDHGELRYVWVHGDHRATFKFRETPDGLTHMSLSVESPCASFKVDL